jgi:CRP-like cAMP-binding protein
LKIFTSLIVEVKKKFILPGFDCPVTFDTYSSTRGGTGIMAYAGTNLEEIKGFLKSGSIPMLAGLNEFALGYLLMVSNVIVKKKNEVLIREGDHAVDYVYIVYKGEVSVIKDGIELVVDGPGTCVGEMISLNVSHERRATVKVKTAEAILVRIPYVALGELKKVYPEESHKLDLNVLNIMWSRLQQIPD